MDELDKMMTGAADGTTPGSARTSVENQAQPRSHSRGEGDRPRSSIRSSTALRSAGRAVSREEKQRSSLPSENHLRQREGGGESWERPDPPHPIRQPHQPGAGMPGISPQGHPYPPHGFASQGYGPFGGMGQPSMFGSPYGFPPYFPPYPYMSPMMSPMGGAGPYVSPPYGSPFPQNQTTPVDPQVERLQKEVEELRVC